ncbi:MAG: cereblon family protein [Desulfovibrio sp.]
MPLLPFHRACQPPRPVPLWGRTPGDGPGKAGQPGRMVEPRAGTGLLDDPLLRCIACRAPITSESRRITVAGDHRHVFANPYGHIFEIGCFSAAPGCLGAGPVTSDFSWFPGTRWQTVLCTVCRLHLGWRYVPVSGGFFFGLILNRLVSGPGEQTR